MLQFARMMQGAVPYGIAGLTIPYYGVRETRASKSATNVITTVPRAASRLADEDLTCSIQGAIRSTMCGSWVPARKRNKFLQS